MTDASDSDEVCHIIISLWKRSSKTCAVREYDIVCCREADAEMIHDF